MLALITLASALVGSSLAGTVIWDGRFNDLSSSTDLNNWSWSNQVGPYQYYIHGTGAVTEYVNLSPSNKNPADSASKQGAKITVDSTSRWNGQTMLRTELIPQTSAPINTGKVYYHFSMSHTGTNEPSPYEEHQVCFFESHFTEMKYGLISGASGTSDTNLRWDVGGQSKWNVNFTAGVWHNIAYGIDFSAQTVEFYHSTGADALTLTAGPFSASTSSNGADWHLGVLRLPSSTGRTDSAPEDWLFSGVYIENGALTTSVSGPAGAGTSSSNKAAVSAVNRAVTPAAYGSEPSTSEAAAPSAYGAESSTSEDAGPPVTLASSVLFSIVPGSESSSSVAAAVPTTLQTSVVVSFSQASPSSSVAELPTAASSYAYSSAEASSGGALSTVTALAETELSIYGALSEATATYNSQATISYSSEATAATSLNTLVLSSGAPISTVGASNISSYPVTSPVYTSTAAAYTTSASNVNYTSSPSEIASTLATATLSPYYTAQPSQNASSPTTAAVSAYQPLTTAPVVSTPVAPEATDAPNPLDVPFALHFCRHHPWWCFWAHEQEKEDDSAGPSYK